MHRWLLLAALMAAATSAWAQQRTWTIARDIYSVDGELIAVRGDTAYLKIGDKVESIPLERLSPADHRYIGTLALAPVTPGPAGDNRLAEPVSGPIIPGPRGDILPVAAEQDLGEHSLIVPASGARAAGAATADAAIAEEVLPVGTSAPTPLLAPPAQGTWNPNTGNPNARQNLQNPQGNANRQPTDSEANRRFWRQQQQQQRQQSTRNANSNRDNDNNESRGRRGLLFGRDR